MHKPRKEMNKTCSVDDAHLTPPGAPPSTPATVHLPSLPRNDLTSGLPPAVLQLRCHFLSLKVQKVEWACFAGTTMALWIYLIEPGNLNYNVNHVIKIVFTDRGVCQDLRRLWWIHCPLGMTATKLFCRAAPGP